MKHSTLFSLILLGLITAFLIGGCCQDEELVSAPEVGLEDPEEQPPVSLSYPDYCFALNVPFITQVPPGDWDNSKNCGQACGVMLGGYFNGGTVAPWVITEENKWLASYTGDNRYRSPNGWYTSGSRLGAFREMLLQFHALHTAVYYGKEPDDVVNEVAHGRPTLVGVRISGGRLVGSGGRSHWALAVGWDGNVILHDPGTNSGRYIRYSVRAFKDSWEEEGKIYIPVWK